MADRSDTREDYAGYGEILENLTNEVAALEAERDMLREALKAVFEVAAVAHGGDPWYCENEGVDVAAAFALARAALVSGDA
jgi:hypothetical protein